jgi:hypothetical protein
VNCVYYTILFKSFLLAHISCAQGFLMTFPNILTMYLGQVHPTIILPHPPSPLLKMISTCFITLFSSKYIKHTDHICPPSLSPFTLPFPPVPIPYRTCFPCLSFILNHICIVQRGFSTVFHLYFNHINLIHYPPYPFSLPAMSQQLTVCFLMPATYIDAIFCLTQG